MFSNIACCSGWMIIAVSFFKVFSSDEAVLQNVVNDGFRTFSGNIVTEFEKVIG